MTTRKILTAAAVLVGGIVASTLPAAAEGGTVPPELRPRVELMCARVPNLQQSVQARLDRIQAGADVRGSIAWLQDLRTKAEARGRTDLVTVIDTRIEVRTKLIPVLERRQEQLVTVAAKCQELGL